MRKARIRDEIERFLSRRRNVEKTPAHKLKGEIFALDRIRGLVALVGNPEKAVPTIHVGGTKGKGSTSYMLESLFSEAGYRTGTYVSPHLESVFERIRVDGRPVRALTLEEAFRHVEAATGELDLAGEAPSAFEVMTALAFMVFARQRVDVAVIEVGLGGRLDATNVVEPEASIITNVGVEHTHFLGKTARKIAAEKAGIVKAGVPLITAAEGDALEVIKKQCRKMGSPLKFMGRDFKIKAARDGRIDFEGSKRLKGIPAPLPGAHQGRNAACALETACLLERLFPGISKAETVKSAFSKLRVPGRMETLKRRPRVVVDSAHTRESVEALVEALPALLEGVSGTKALVFASMEDKNHVGMLKALCKSFDYFVFTSTGSERSAKPGKLAGVFRKLSNKSYAKTPNADAALKKAMTGAGRDGAVVAVGSFGLAGLVKALLRNPR